LARGRSRGDDLVRAAGCSIWFRVWCRDRTDLAADEQGEPAVTFDGSRPSIARVYDVMLGGKDNFAADREVAAKLIAAYPLFANWAKENRVFLGRAVSYAASRGVGQFIDVGSGLPTSPNTHEIARREIPGARVVYVDNDPMVITHIRALLASDDGIAAVEGDLRDPEAILAAPQLAAVIDMRQPVCVLLVSVLHFVDEQTARKVAAGFMRPVPAGSYLVLSAGTGGPEFEEELGPLYTAADAYNHSPEQIRGLFGDLDLISPGLVDAGHWRPGWAPPQQPQRKAMMLAGVAHKRT